jgi:hypothetical protein
MREANTMNLIMSAIMTYTTYTNSTALKKKWYDYRIKEGFVDLKRVSWLLRNL